MEPILSKDAVSSLRNYIKTEFGNDYLPNDPLNYSGKKGKKCTRSS